MTPVGETLRRERLRRNLDFEQISRELKISTRFLEAIENDQYDKLPGGVFARSFVRQYARLLGLDEESLAGQLQSSLAPDEAPHFTEKPSAASVAPIQVPRVEEWETVGDRRFRWGGSLGSGVLVVVVMLICSAVYAWLQRPKTTPAPSPAPIAQSAPAPAAVQPPAPPPESTPAATTTPVPAPAADQGGASPATEPKAADQKPAQQQLAEQKPAEQKPPATKPPPNPDATVHVDITADEPVWVLARTDGKYLFSGTLTPGQTRSVEAVKDVVLRLGNAGGVAITLNGKALGSVGPKGQPRTVQLTSGGFQIVPAKPPSAPFDPIDRL